jgi:hypothetical protein
MTDYVKYAPCFFTIAARQAFLTGTESFVNSIVKLGRTPFIVQHIKAQSFQRTSFIIQEGWRSDCALFRRKINGARSIFASPLLGTSFAIAMALCLGIRDIPSAKLLFKEASLDLLGTLLTTCRRRILTLVASPEVISFVRGLECIPPQWLHVHRSVLLVVLISVAEFVIVDDLLGYSALVEEKESKDQKVLHDGHHWSTKKLFVVRNEGSAFVQVSYGHTYMCTGINNSR